MDDSDSTRAPVFAWLRRSLARDTAALVLGLCLVAAALTALSARHVLDSTVRHGVSVELEREHERAQAALEMWRRTELEDATAIARDRALLSALAQGPAGREKARARLEELYAAEPEAFGFALASPGALSPDLSVGQLPLDNWAALIGGRTQKSATLLPARLNDTTIDLARAMLANDPTPLVLWVAFDPLEAFNLLDGDPHVSAALVDAEGHVLAGATELASQPNARGYSDALDEDGETLLTLRRGLPGTPWQLVVARPLPTLPANTLLTIALGSALVALVAGVLAFGISAWRLRPLLDLAEVARRLAAGDFSVRMSARDTRDEVQTLARAFNEMASQLDAQRRALEERNQELLRANEVLEQLSITDGLTHMHNHRHFHDQFAREVKRAERSGQPLCLLLVDIDDFKLLNDRHGHAVGDRVLAETAQLVNSQVRESDYLARYGGEEFALLLPQTALAGAVALAEKVRASISDHIFVLPNFSQSLRVTVSIGVAQFANGAEETFDAADRALYDAKAAGKDCVVGAAPADQTRAPSPKRRR